VPLGTSLSESLSSFTTSRHDDSMKYKSRMPALCFSQSLYTPLGADLVRAPPKSADLV
jgi:hypothetical protein